MDRTVFGSARRGAYRRHKWPILGQTVLDALRVIDWAAGALGAGPPVAAGGISLGGETDFHVPADGALRFQAALAAAHPHAAGRVRVTVHPGIGHLGAIRDGGLHQRCLQWFASPAPGA
jgi:hypothetical protein